MSNSKWKDGTPLPSTVSATYKGLLKACTEEGVPLGALFAHPDMPFNEHDVTDLQRRIAAMASVHNVQVDMISRLAAERNKALQEAAKLQEMIDAAPYDRALMYHPESDALFEAGTLREYFEALDHGCDDVSDYEDFEVRFDREEAARISAQADEM